MAFTGTEYFQAGLRSHAMTASSTHIVGLLTTSPRDLFSVFTASTNTALVYGLPEATTTVALGSIVYAGGKFWYSSVVGSSAAIAWIDPSGWTASLVGSHSGGVGSITACGDWIYGSGHRYNMSTNTYSTHARTVSWWGSVGGRLFAVSGTTLTEVNPSDASVLGTWTLSKSCTGQGVALGTKLYFGATDNSTPLCWFDAATDTVGARSATPPLSNASSLLQWVAHSDGYLYNMIDDAGTRKLLVLDPATGRWYMDIAVTNRDSRYSVASCGSKLYIQTSVPSSWP